MAVHLTHSNFLLMLLCQVASLGYLLRLSHRHGLIYYRWDRGRCLLGGEGDFGFHLPDFPTLVVHLPAVFLYLGCLVLLRFAPVSLAPMVVLDLGLLQLAGLLELALAGGPG